MHAKPQPCLGHAPGQTSTKLWCVQDLLPLAFNEEPRHDNLGTCSLLCSFTRILAICRQRPKQFEHGKKKNRHTAFTLLKSLGLCCFLKNSSRTCFFFSSAFNLERLGLYIIRVRPIWPTATEPVNSSNCFTTSSNSPGQLRCILICKCHSNWKYKLIRSKY